MKKLLSWLFYWAYYYMKKLKTDNDPLRRAFFLMIWLQGFNFMTMVFFINFYIKKKWGISIFDYVVLDRKNIYLWLIVALVCSPIFIGNYVFVYNKKRCAKIDAHYTQMSASKLSKSKFLFWVYFFATIILLFVTLNYTSKKKEDVPIKQELNFDNFPSPTSKESSPSCRPTRDISTKQRFLTPFEMTPY